MSAFIEQATIDCWRINYGLDKRTPAEAALWWHENMGGCAPAGSVAALGLVLYALDDMRAALQEADTIMSHDDAETAWRERWAGLWPAAPKDKP